jgi:hypothetical protein
LFDVFNSRNLHAKGFKQPLQAANYTKFSNFLLNARSYITSLKESRNGKLLIESNRKTGFIGFVTCIDSLLKLYDSLIVSGKMSFICTYKLNQDHIELFFGKIRSLGGFNNNPSASQFSSAYKKLLVNNEINDVLRGNCLPLEHVPVLTVSSSSCGSLETETPSVAALNNSLACNGLLETDEIAVGDHDYIYVPQKAQLSRCSEKIVAYIAGFVVFKLKKLMRCRDCIASLSDDSSTRPSCSLIQLKSKGCLIYPSDDVIDICVTCEKIFRKSVLETNESKLSNVASHRLIQSVLKVYQRKPILSCLNLHVLECDPLANHMLLLIKAISEKYLQVRYYYAGKQFTARLHANKTHISRQVHTKLILFSGQ